MQTPTNLVNLLLRKDRTRLHAPKINPRLQTMASQCCSKRCCNNFKKIKLNAQEHTHIGRIHFFSNALQGITPSLEHAMMFHTTFLFKNVTLIQISNKYDQIEGCRNCLPKCFDKLVKNWKTKLINLGIPVFYFEKEHTGGEWFGPIGDWKLARVRPQK